MKNIYFNIPKCLSCRSCELACAVAHSKSQKLSLAISELPLPINRRKLQRNDKIVISNSCQHCKDALCVKACMSAAMYKDKDGSTQHDEDKCVGCWMCIMVCPFGAISRKQKIALKCDLCKDREKGPACVETCPTKALVIEEVLK